MGCSYQDLNMLEDAIRCFTAAIRQRSTFPDAYVSLGQCFLEVGRIRDAVVCMEKALTTEFRCCDRKGVRQGKTW